MGGERQASTDGVGTRQSTLCRSPYRRCARLATYFTAAGNCVEVDNNLVLQVLSCPTLHCSSHSQFAFVQLAILNSLAVMNFSNDECSRTQIQMQVSPTGARFSRHVQHRRLIVNKICTQLFHSFPVVSARRFESSNQIPFTATCAAQNSPKVGRSHRHQCLDSVRPAAVNRRPAPKPNCGRSQICVLASNTTRSTAGLAMQCAQHVR